MLRKKEVFPHIMLNKKLLLMMRREIQALTYTKPNREKHSSRLVKDTLKFERALKSWNCTDHLFKAAENKYIEPWPAVTYGTRIMVKIGFR